MTVNSKQMRPHLVFITRLQMCDFRRPGQLNLLPPAEREMSTGQSAVMCCGRAVKAGRLTQLVDKRVGGR